ncbi:hypothetical protein [Chryseobacterium taiwanense]|nr:hypothetical protein [Chryseobacterium taiwanense]
MKEAKSRKLILAVFIIFFTFFGQCKDKHAPPPTSTNFKFDGRFKTDDEITFKLNQTILKLFSDKPNHVEIFTSKENKIDITEENHCNMDAVGISVYQYTNLNDPSLRVILLEYYQDILIGSLYAILVDKNKLIKTFRLCGPQYNYEKYQIKDVLSIKKLNNQISFIFNPNKIAAKNKNQYIFNFSIDNTKSDNSISKNNSNNTIKETLKTTFSNEKVIDSLVFDFNNDQIKDKILIHANPKEKDLMGDEYFDNINSYYRTLDILVGKPNKKYIQTSSNKNIIPCLRCNEPMKAYSDLKIIGKNSFSVDVIQKAENTIYQLLFEWKQNNFYLTQIGVKSFYDENSKTIKLKNSININDVMVNNILDYIK